MLEAIVAITDASSSDTSDRALVVAPSNSLVEFVETSDFEQAVVLTAASRVYPLIADDQTEAERNQFLDRIMWFNGRVPLTLTQLPESTKQRCLDGLARLLVETVRREELEALGKNLLRFKDLGLEDPVNQTLRQIVGPQIGLLGSNL
jgi:hypothetical protein